MTQQIGFDFGGIAATFKEEPAGSWNAPQWTEAECTMILAKAESALMEIAGPARALFRKGIEAAKKEQERLAEYRDEGDTFDLEGLGVDSTDDEAAMFAQHCKNMSNSAFTGIEYKTREGFRSTESAMYVKDVGTLEVWNGVRGMRVTYTPSRSSFFLASYQDDLTVIEAPARIWEDAYCADKLANAGKGIPSVPSFAYNGRRYLITAVMFNGPQRKGWAWTFRRIEDWTGPTYSYESQHKAVDNGLVERGDHRGQIVRVDGKLCVIDGHVVFFDDHAESSTMRVDEEADELDELELTEDESELAEA